MRRCSAVGILAVLVPVVVSAQQMEMGGGKHELGADIVVSEGTPPVVNTPDAAGWAAQAARETLGDGAGRPLGTTNMGGEDFAFYLERMPGCFLRIGAREAGGQHLDVHTLRFYPAEEALFVGAAVLAQCARVAGESLT